MTAPRRVALLLWSPLAAGLALQFVVTAGPWPVWARTWTKFPAPPVKMASAAGLSLADLAEISPGRLSGASSRDGPFRQFGFEHNDWRGSLKRLFADIRRTEGEQRHQAAAEWVDYLAVLVDRRMAEAQLGWEQQFRDLAIRLGEENDRTLTTYAADIRREYFSDVSYLEMQITLSEDEDSRKALEAKLAEVRKEMERKIADRRRELADQCAAALADLHNQARESLAALSTALKQEAAASLKAFRDFQDGNHQNWLNADAAAEAEAEKERDLASGE